MMTIIERMKRDNPGVATMMSGFTRMTREERGECMARKVSQALAKQIRTNRLARRLTLKQLADRAGISYITLWRIERTRGILQCSLTTLTRIAAALECALMCMFVSYSDACCHLILISANGYYATSFSDEMASYQANEAIEVMALETLADLGT